MEPINLMKLNALLINHHIFIEHNTCGYTWSVIYNSYENKPKYLISKFVDHLENIIPSDFNFKCIKEKVIKYEIYRDDLKIMTFYKCKDKKSKHGILIINDYDILSDIIDLLDIK